MGVPAHRILLPNEGERMGIYTGPAPKEYHPFRPLSYEEQVERHCRREAEREVESWFTCRPYRPAPFRYRPGKGSLHITAIERDEAYDEIKRRCGWTRQPRKRGQSSLLPSSEQ